MTRYLVLTAAACMPGSCWGTYRRVAVVEVDPALVPEGGPRMISERARGVTRVVATWERRNVGKTGRCAYEVALAEANQLAADLNNGGAK